ncbi:ubiE/COQ5 methyltransferase [Rickenella mellea]|uniref:Arsenite methyltransferase n=1 Tax=Rickenella mellea TaxID=50990 RepID=A0A4Y7PNG7_9AGAM|nr:ubiE/COQ5 methyltransferase [Rickenella mellea]
MAQVSLSEYVNERYSNVARSARSSEYSGNVASLFGYSHEELEKIPGGANMGLSCGNPTAVANIRKGEVVVDLGCGGGMDVFLAAEKVGSTGKVIGLDFSKVTIDLPKRNAIKRVDKENVRFELAEITSMPLSNNTVDCVISNCVINLVPDAEKQRVMDEIFRILKPGGRLSISDIAARKPLPAEVRSDLSSYVGCVSGALEVTRYREMLMSAGFPDAVFFDMKTDLGVYKSANDNSSGCCSSKACCASDNRLGGIPSTLDYDINEFAGSFQIYALKSE